jgi:hypothetical protein
MAKELLGSGDELCTVSCLTQSIGADDTQSSRRDVPQPLAKTSQTIKRPLLRSGRKPVSAIQSGGQLDHLAQSVENLNMPIRDARDDHVKTV